MRGGSLRFRNLSGLTVPRTLWIELANGVGLGGALRRAVDDDLGLYVGSNLRVTVNRMIERGDRNVVAGTYTYGHISLYPCSTCNVAFLTEVYLHELVHAWVDEFREREVYDHWEACAVADKFAAQAFRRLGGRVNGTGSRRLCHSYSLSVERAALNVPRITETVEWMRSEIPHLQDLSRKGAATGFKDYEVGETAYGGEETAERNPKPWTR